MADIELSLFTCPRYTGGLRLTPAGCASMYRRGKLVTDPYDTAAQCRGCPIGAEHAGEALSVPILWRRACVRCGSTGKRLVLGGTLCVSCYNRQREIETGNYRRGVPPQNVALRAATVVVSIDLMPRQITAANSLEAMLRIAKENPNTGIQAVSFCQQMPWAASCHRKIQLSLLPGL